MIGPGTSQKRLLEIDKEGCGFLYVMSSNSTTGGTKRLAESESYLGAVSWAGPPNAHRRWDQYQPAG